MEEPHVTGTKSFARLAHEEAIKNNGVELQRGEIYQKSRTRRDGSFVNEKAAQVVASLQAVANDPANTHTLEDDWRNDDFSKVMGPEKSGYVRCLGKMPSVKDKGTTSSMDPTRSLEHRLAQTECLVTNLVNLIKNHIPTANLSDVLGSMNMEVTRNVSIYHNNHPNGNQRSSAGSHNAGSSSNRS